MADTKKRPEKQIGAPKTDYVGKSQREDEATGNLASSQRGLDDINRAAALPDPAMLAALVQGAGPQMAGAMPPAGPQMGVPGGHASPMGGAMGASGGADTTHLDQPATEFRPAGSRITKEMLQKATRTLHKYRAGKASVERRVIEAQEWWKLHNWEQIEARGINGSHDSKSNTAWLWNCIVGKHADAVDAYPEPAILPRMEDDKAEAANLSDIVPVVLKLNDFERVYSDVAWQKMLEGTGAYGVFWDEDKMNGLGDISVQKVNILNLFWEPGVTNLQDSKNLFHVALMDNDVIKQIYPQLANETLSSPATISKYRYDDAVSTTDKSLVIDWYFHQYVGKRKILHYVKYVGEHVLYSTLDDPACAERGKYDDGLYPFVLDPLFPVEGSPCGFGYIHVGKDTQKDIDLMSQAVVTNAVVNATPRWFSRQDGGINEQEAADLTKTFIHYTGNLNGENLIPVVNPQLPGNVVDVLAMKVDELKFVTGNADVNNGGAPSGVTAASAIAALQEQSGRSSRASNRAAYHAYSQVVTMVIERIRQFYDLPRQFRIVGPRGEERFLANYTNAKLVPQYQGNEFGVDMGYRLPVFDVDVRAQRETAYTKAAQNELAIQLLQLGFFNPNMANQSVMALDMMDFKGKDELAQKITQMGTMAQALQQLGQIASEMAMELEDPQAAAMIQQIAMMASSGGAASPAMGMQNAFQMPQSEATVGNLDHKEHAFVEKARKQSEEATKPQ